MGAETKISWAHATFNPWWGCEKVSQECAHCYAETLASRWKFDVWGKNSPRRFFGDKHWNEPLKWNALAAESGTRRRVFCASMADVFEDRRDLDESRARLWDLIWKTPHLDWLLLTKRPENADAMVPASWWHGPNPNPPINVWLGATVGDNENLERVDHVRRATWPVVRFLSMEPLLADVDVDLTGIDWVITGDESGHHRRPTDEDWKRRLRNRAIAAGAAFFYKQKVLASGVKVELPELDGVRWDQLPTVRP